MPLSRLKGSLAQSLLGGGANGPELAVLPDRTFERSQGCWNCIHAQSPIDRWMGKDADGKGGVRGQMLSRAAKLAVNSPRGERADAVVRIRRAVERIDFTVMHQLCFVCDHGVTEDRNPVGDFVASVFLCDNWSGRDGASLARRSDGKLDDLPGELRDKIDGSGPMNAEEYIEKLQGGSP